MISSFSCKTIRLEDVFRCAFTLDKTEYTVLIYLLRNDDRFTTIQISEEIGLDRTTVQKALSGLLDKDLVRRTQQNLKEGGYTFLYATDKKEEIKRTIIERVQDWCDDVNKLVKEW